MEQIYKNTEDSNFIPECQTRYCLPNTIKIPVIYLREVRLTDLTSRLSVPPSLSVEGLLQNEDNRSQLLSAERYLKLAHHL